MRWWLLRWPYVVYYVWCDVMSSHVLLSVASWYDMIWYDMIWYDMIWYDMIWYDMTRLIWCGMTLLYHVIFFYVMTCFIMLCYVTCNALHSSCIYMCYVSISLLHDIHIYYLRTLHCTFSRLDYSEQWRHAEGSRKRTHHPKYDQWSWYRVQEKLCATYWWVLCDITARTTHPWKTSLLSSFTMIFAFQQHRAANGCFLLNTQFFFICILLYYWLYFLLSSVR